MIVGCCADCTNTCSENNKKFPVVPIVQSQEALRQPSHMQQLYPEGWGLGNWCKQMFHGESRIDSWHRMHHQAHEPGETETNNKISTMRKTADS
jgi:hypothetical protein